MLDPRTLSPDSYGVWLEELAAEHRFGVHDRLGTLNYVDRVSSLSGRELDCARGERKPRSSAVAGALLCRRMRAALS